MWRLCVGYDILFVNISSLLLVDFHKHLKWITLVATTVASMMFLTFPSDVLTVQSF